MLSTDKVTPASLESVLSGMEGIEHLGKAWVSPSVSDLNLRECDVVAAIKYIRDVILPAYESRKSSDVFPMPASVQYGVSLPSGASNIVHMTISFNESIGRGTTSVSLYKGSPSQLGSPILQFGPIAVPVSTG